MEPMALFGIQFTLSLAAYSLIGARPTSWIVRSTTTTWPRTRSSCPDAVATCVTVSPSLPPFRAVAGSCRDRPWGPHQ